MVAVMMDLVSAKQWEAQLQRLRRFIMDADLPLFDTVGMSCVGLVPRLISSTRFDECGADSQLSRGTMKLGPRSDSRLYWPSNQHAVRTATPTSSVQATGVMAMNWFILERRVRYGEVSPAHKDGGRPLERAMPHRHRKVEQKSFAVAKVRPATLIVSS
jgi:hypothetical protein